MKVQLNSLHLKLYLKMLFLGNLNGTTASPTLFMSDNLLNDDLQLSESESDSD